MLIAFLFGRAVDMAEPPAPADRKRALFWLGCTLAVPLVPVLWCAMREGATWPYAARVCARKAWFDALAVGVSLVVIVALLVAVPLLPESAWNHIWWVLGGILAGMMVPLVIITWWSIVSIVALRHIERGKDFRFPIVG